MYTVDPYLLEDNLGELLCAVFGENNVTPQKTFQRKDGLETVLSQPKVKVDFYISRSDLPEDIIVEYNGPRHYTTYGRIIRDYEVREMAKMIGIRLVEIPYFVQMNNYTFSEYFGRDVKDIVHPDIVCEWPSGFVSKKIIMPYDYCILGVERFKNDLSFLSKVKVSNSDHPGTWVETARSIINSLKVRKDRYYDDFEKRFMS